MQLQHCSIAAWPGPGTIEAVAGCNVPTCGQEGSCAHRWQPHSLQKKRVLVLGCRRGEGQGRAGR